MALKVDPQTACYSRASPCALTGGNRAAIADVQQIVNEALGAVAASDDLNGDGTVNALDVQRVLNAALSGGCFAG